MITKVKEISQITSKQTVFMTNNLTRMYLFITLLILYITWSAGVKEDVTKYTNI